MYDGAPAYAPHRRALDTIEAYAERTGSGYVVDAFWSAWDAVAAAASYRDTIQRAVRTGHDTDTTAAIAGGLAGAWFGLEGIPPDWLGRMRGHSIVAPLLDRLLEQAGWRTSSGHPLRVDWVDQGAVPAAAGWRGRLGMTFLPGGPAGCGKVARWRSPAGVALAGPGPRWRA